MNHNWIVYFLDVWPFLRIAHLKTRGDDMLLWTYHLNKYPHISFELI